jgi:catechol 2,3-dioxygenase-like lactoylglutathione lyase family enzyme
MERSQMNWTLEVVLVPVSDVDRAISFYADKLGFNIDHDTNVSPEVRFAQLTPPGSGCSIVLAKGITPGGRRRVGMEPGSLHGLQLVVNDVRIARAELLERGVDVSELEIAGLTGTRPADEDDDLNNVGFFYFNDPDGNGWAVQQVTARP